jgi:hypothetical protein
MHKAQLSALGAILGRDMSVILSNAKDLDDIREILRGVYPA